MNLIKILPALAGAFIFTLLMVAPASARCNQVTGTGCTAIESQTGRDTSNGQVTALSDHCDAVLRRVDEPVGFSAVPGGAQSFDPRSHALAGLSWASNTMAGDRFGDLNLHFADNREIVETELCASSGVWANALDQLGVTIEDIRNGSVDIFLCGETWAHRIPKQRILAILQGHQESRGQYSVLSGPETAAIAERLTQLGY